MNRTFEERVGEELDALFQGALFLRGGDPEAAEDLLVAVLRDSFDVFSRGGGGEGFRGWLQGRLATGSLLDLPERDRTPRVSRTKGGSGKNAADFFASAGAVPPRARAALYLIFLCRWKYDAAAERLDLPREDFVELLGYRSALDVGTDFAGRLGEGGGRR